MERETQASEGSIWSQVESAIEAKQNQDSVINLFTLVQQYLDLSNYSPVRISNAELADVSSSPDKKEYMLRNPRDNLYLKLGEGELFLWNLMDGKNTIKDLSLKYIDRYGFIGEDVLFNLLDLLKKNDFLQERPLSMVQSLNQKLNQKKFQTNIIYSMKFLIHSTFTTHHADPFFAWLYRTLARPFFSPPGWLIIFSLLVVNTLFSIYFIFVRHIGLMVFEPTTQLHDLIIMIFISYGSLFLHECSHGVTVKHYGRKVLRAGLMLYLGQPIAYVDTTDIWMKSKYPRIAVSFAGPCFNGILGGIFFLVALFFRQSSIYTHLIQGGLLNSVLFFANLLPFIETDGHYIIQDYFEMPHLRPDSLTFVGKGMWRKLIHHEKWGKIDYIYFIYGIIAVAGMIFIVYMSIHLWFSTGNRIIMEFIAHPDLFIRMIIVLMVVAAVAHLLRYGFHLKWQTGGLEKLLKKRLRRGY